MFTGKAIEYEVSPDVHAIGAGGLGLIQQMVQRLGLPRAIDRRLKLLKVHLPYHESDHVLSLAYNILAGGTCIEDLEHLRQDEGALNALGTKRIPDPTTAGDFCRRFRSDDDHDALTEAVNDIRVKVWQRQPDEFFREAVIDADGTLVATDGECKAGADFAYDGTYGYHPLLVSLRNTQEPLFLKNRSGNRPSDEGAHELFDRAIELCRRAGFRKIRLQGDTAFSQSAHLERWDDQSVGFLFGWDANASLIRIAQSKHPIEWMELKRPPKYEIKTEPRERPFRVKDALVEARGFRKLTTVKEEVSSFDYCPSLCTRNFRIVALKKTIEVVEGQRLLLPEIRHFFFITNDRTTSKTELVLRANARADQENLIEQLKNGARAMRMPVNDLTSNGAYMLMTSLAWTLKAWLALLLPENGVHSEQRRADKSLVLRMEFKRFLAGFMQIPAQIVRTGRRIIYRLLAWNPMQPIFLRAATLLERPLRC